MSRVRGKDTSPEMIVRRSLHAAGYRYRLHGHHLPGNPDLVFSKRRKVIFVHGCFWHQHHCAKAKRPATNVEFWNKKLDGNLARDRANLTKLHEMGWETLVIWECEISHGKELVTRLAEFLDN